MRFILGWITGFILLVIISCVKHWDFIMAAVGNNLWTLFNAAMPSVIIIVMIFYMIKSVFK